MCHPDKPPKTVASTVFMLEKVFKIKNGKQVARNFSSENTYVRKSRKE